MRATRTTPGRATAMVRTIAVTALACTLAACGTEAPEDGSTAGPDGSAADASGDGAAGAEETTDASGGEAASGDPYCDAMIDGTASYADAMEALGDSMLGFADPAAMEDGDMTSINEAGAVVLGFAREASDTYAEAATLVDDTDVKEGIDGLARLMDLYSIPFAQAMIDATSFEDLGTATAEIGTDPEITELLETVPAYGETVAEYTADRCGVELDELD